VNETREIRISQPERERERGREREREGEKGREKATKAIPEVAYGS